MTKQETLLNSMLKLKPDERHKFLFAVKDKVLASKIITCDFYSVAIDEEFSASEFCELYCKALTSGTYATDYIVVPYLSGKDSNEVKMFCKTNNVPIINDVWKVFKDREFLFVDDNNEDATKELCRELEEFIKKHSPSSKKRITLKPLSSYEEKEIEWLIPNWIPKNTITIFAGDGGVGKSTLIFNLVASVSSGQQSIFEHDIPFKSKTKPKTVIVVSSEDEVERAMKPKLRKLGANQENVITIDLEEEGFSDIKLGSEIFENMIEDYKPDLVVLDPLQSFINSNVQMISRNAMRNVLNPLMALGEKYETTFIIVMHTNKQSGAYGRRRLSDSSDMWDIARSVCIVGHAENGERYVSHEKCNYGKEQETILFKMSAEHGVDFVGTTEKKDRDFMMQSGNNEKGESKLQVAKQIILESLKESDGTVALSEVDKKIADAEISSATYRRAKEELKKLKIIKIYSIGFENKKFYITTP